MGKSSIDDNRKNEALICFLLSVLIVMCNDNSNIKNKMPPILLLFGPLVPHCYLVIKGMKSDIISSIILTIGWSIYMNILIAPFYILINKFFSV